MKRLILIMLVISFTAARECMADPTGTGALRSELRKLAPICTTRPATTSDFTVLLVRRAPRQVVVVQRHGPDDLMLSCDGAGRPIGFAKNGALFCTNNKYPGQLLRVSNASWSLIVHDGDISLDPGKRSNGAQRILWWDPASVVSLFLHANHQLEHDPSGSVYRISASGSTLELATAVNEEKQDYVDFFSAYHAGESVSMMCLPAAIPTDLDLQKIQPLVIDQLNLPGRTIAAESLSDLSGESDPEDRTKEELQISDALSHVLPVGGCMSELLRATASERLKITASIAIDLAGDDPELRKRIEYASDERAALLRSVCAELSKERIDLASAYRQLKKLPCLSTELASLLSKKQYIDFSLRYSASPMPCEFATKELAIRRAVLHEAESLGLSQDLMYQLAVECISNDEKVEEISSSYFVMKFSGAEVVKEMGQLNIEISDALRSLGLPPDQLDAIVAKIDAVRERYNRESTPIR